MITCPYCGKKGVDHSLSSYDGYEYPCGTFVSTMRIEEVVHRSMECVHRGRDNDN